MVTAAKQDAAPEAEPEARAATQSSAAAEMEAPAATQATATAEPSDDAAAPLQITAAVPATVEPPALTAVVAPSATETQPETAVPPAVAAMTSDDTVGAIEPTTAPTAPVAPSAQTVAVAPETATPDAEEPNAEASPDQNDGKAVGKAAAGKRPGAKARRAAKGRPRVYAQPYTGIGRTYAAMPSQTGFNTSAQASLQPAPAPRRVVRVRRPAQAKNQAKNQAENQAENQGKSTAVGGPLVSPDGHDGK